MQHNLEEGIVFSFLIVNISKYLNCVVYIIDLKQD